MTNLAPTLHAALEAAAARSGAGFTHIADEKQPAQVVTYAELALRARQVAAALQDAGLRKGDRVALILPDSVEFIDCIFGCMYAGVIAVPMYPPMNLAQLEVWLAGCGHTLRQAGCRLVITDARVRALLGTLMDAAPALRAVETLAGLLGRVAANAAPKPVDIVPDDVAFLQFTSGSTSRPKGVTLTHANLLANVAAIGGALGLGCPDEHTGVSWLPLYHDMGLIGFVFSPVCHMSRSVTLLAPLLFLKRPSLWLRQLSERQAQVTFAPNFAYGLATARVRDDEISGLDLSALKVAGCGAEPIQHRTLQAFAARYAPYGFRRQAFLSCYGMAEHSLAVSFIGLDDDLRAERVELAALAEGEARLSEAEDALEVVSCGRALPGHAIRITAEEGAALPDGQVGQIELSGPSVMRGYWGDPERTQAVLRDGWLSTGDLGYLRDGELYVCGRIKDVIILNGRNFYPSDLEWQASQVEGVRRGNVVAFGISDPSLGRERVVMVVEARDPDDADRLRDAVTAQVLKALSLRVDEVLLLPPGSLPKTSSGKLQRARTAEMYARGELGRAGAGKLALVRQLAASRWSYLKAGFTRRDPDTNQP